MKINTLLIVVAMCLSHLLSAQIVSTSNHFFTNGVNLTEGFHTIPASDGGYVIIGTQGLLDLSNTNDPWIIRLDENENVEWEFLIDFAGEGFYDFGYRGIEVSDGYIILGSFADPMTFSQFASLFKIDFDGNLMWSKVLDDFKDTAYGAMLLLDNDELLIGGYRNKELLEGETSVAKFDSDGNEIWNKGYIDYNDVIPLWAFSDLALTDDGHILFTCRANDTPHISKINQEGNEIWNTDLAINGGGINVQPLDNGEIVVLATLNYAFNPSNDFLFRLDGQGNILNSHQFDFNMIEATSDAVLDNEGNLYIVGGKFSDDTGILLKTNANGDTIWTQTFTAPDSISGVVFHGIELTDNHKLLITGLGTVPFGIASVTRHMHLMILDLEAPPTAAFNFNASGTCAPLTVNFTDSSSNNTTAWNWSFPGATPSVSSEQNPTVIYGTPGTYDVILTTSNAFGSSTIAQTAVIVVESYTPTASFVPTISSQGNVNFLNNSTNGTQFEWSFGDGNTSTEENPSHTYATSGTYEITLTVTNSCGSVTITQEVSIIVTSNEEIGLFEKIDLYPNPNHGAFTVHLEGIPTKELQFNLYNILGQEIHQEALDFSNGKIVKTFHFENLAAANYILQIQSEGKMMYKKIVVE